MLSVASRLGRQLGAIYPGVERHLLLFGPPPDDPGIQADGVGYLMGRKGYGLVLHTVFVAIDNCHV